MAEWSRKLHEQLSEMKARPGATGNRGRNVPPVNPTQTANGT